MLLSTKVSFRTTITKDVIDNASENFAYFLFSLFLSHFHIPLIDQ